MGLDEAYGLHIFFSHWGRMPPLPAPSLDAFAVTSNSMHTAVVAVVESWPILPVSSKECYSGHRVCFIIYSEGPCTHIGRRVLGKGRDKVSSYIFLLFNDLSTNSLLLILFMMWFQDISASFFASDVLFHWWMRDNSNCQWCSFPLMDERQLKSAKKKKPILPPSFDKTTVH
jgi:hypothetical protein